MKLYLLWAAVFVASAAVAKGPAKEKEKKDKKAETYVFQDVKTVPVTSVKDQSRSGTCWSFSGMGEVESDLLVRGKGEHDLAEMWIVRNAYFEKAVRYVRMHGSANLGGGGTLNDVVYIIDRYGIVPEEVYPGLRYGTDRHVHGELDAVIKAYVDAVVENPNKSLSTAWQDGLNGILDAYLGPRPEKFAYRGKEYTPKSFAEELGIRSDDYVHLRPDTVIGDNVKIGNFVEVKNSHVGTGSKLPHLSYIGDSDIGSSVNIGCGCITVNYDGKKKNRTIIEDNAFVGCNTLAD